MLHSAFSPDLATHEERRSLLIFKTEREIAAYVDRLDLGDGAVLTDTAYAYSVVMSSAHHGSSSSPRTAISPVPWPIPPGTGSNIYSSPLRNSATLMHCRPMAGLYETAPGIATVVQTFEGAFFGTGGCIESTDPRPEHHQPCSVVRVRLRMTSNVCGNRGPTS